MTGKGLSTEDYSTAEKTKLAGIATGATANSSDATLLARANHTGTQLASTISDFAATVRATVLTGLSTATNAAITAADTVLAALGKLQAQITGHTGASSGAHAASAISNTPAGNIAAATVQAAINELDSEKQATLVSGTNIKTVNGSTLLGSGNVDVGGAVNGLLKVNGAGVYSQAVAGTDYQAPLVSGTNIKTAGGQSLLGSGDAPIVAPETTAASSKSTPVDADYVPLVDSAAANGLKKLTWANLKLTLAGVFREKLTAARTYYVRSDGSDSNDGLANTSGGAFLTLQKAIDIASALDNGGFNITLQMGDATYSAGATLKSFVGSGRIIVLGNQTTPANVHISVASGACVSGTNVQGIYEIRYLKLTSASTGNLVTLTGSTTFVVLQGLNYGSTGSGGYAHVSCQNGATADFAATNYSITGGAGYHLYTNIGGRIGCNVLTCTLTGTPAFANAFAYAGLNAVTRVVSVTFSGSATGKRYEAVTNGVIDVAGAGATYLPGNASGTVDATGVYA